MRCLERIGLAALGLALATATPVRAQSPVTPVTYVTAAPQSSPQASPQATPQSSSNYAPAHRHSRGIFGNERHCVECKLARMRAQGISVPPPPPLPMGGMVVEMGNCTTCETGTVVTPSPQGGIAPSAQGVALNGGEAPGRAAVGAEAAPGYAVVGEPAPIGAVAARRGGRKSRGGAPADGSVMPTSVSAPDTFGGAGESHPHILAHLFGLSALGRDARDMMMDREQKARDKHASIAYGAQNAKVTDLPASMVYGGGGGR